jgi:3-oxoacyl-[acyl-carrier-protein] synthase-1
MTGRAPVFLSALGIVSALGRGQAEVRANLLAGAAPGVVRRHDLLTGGQAVDVGEVQGALPVVPRRLAAWASRNAALMIAALEEIRPQLEAALARYGRGRIAVVMGTSTSGLAEGERALDHALATGALPERYDFRQQELGSAGELVARYLGLEGPAYTVSTACSSSSHALAAARRLLRTGLADAVVAGGADSLCRLTVNGFRALSALSAGRCNPFSRNRDGTMIGEGAAVLLVERQEAEIALYGVGASSEAYSMTAPEPDGRGIEDAVKRALADSGRAAADIDYIQLHGTGTEQNDAVESKVVLRLFGDRVPCSSSKAQIGHTLGAAGAMGIGHCWLTASHSDLDGLLPPHLWDGMAEEGLLSTSLVRPGQRLDPAARRIFLSNAFGFGGSNVCLVVGRWQ